MTTRFMIGGDSMRIRTDGCFIFAPNVDRALNARSANILATLNPTRIRLKQRGSAETKKSAGRMLRPAHRIALQNFLLNPIL
jgi:hypothetical protein